MVTKFDQNNIEAVAPIDFGVYQLYDSGFTVIYIGRAMKVNLRERLLNHVRGYDGLCTKEAAYFDCRVVENPEVEEVKMLETFKRTHGKLPRCNERIG